LDTPKRCWRSRVNEYTAQAVAAEQWTENRRQRAEEERRQRVMVITEFEAGDPEATMHALADET
jgi:hypothetical protein